MRILFEENGKLYRFDGYELNPPGFSPDEPGVCFLEEVSFLISAESQDFCPTENYQEVHAQDCLKAIADVRNEIVDAHPKLDPIQLAHIAKDLLQIIERPYAEIEIAELKAELADELEKWQPLITMFHKDKTIPFTD